MAVDRVKELVQEGLRRKLSGDLQGAADAWAEALRLDPSNKRAVDGLADLERAGVVPLPVPSSPARLTPALGLMLQAAPRVEARTAAKDPFARHDAAPFESTPSPFPAAPQTPPPGSFAGPRLVAQAPPGPPDPAAFASGSTRVFGGAPPPPPSPPSSSTEPVPYESSSTMAFGLPAAGPAAASPFAAVPFDAPQDPGGAGPAQPFASVAMGTTPPALKPEREGAAFPFDLEDSPTLDKSAQAARTEARASSPLPFEAEPFNPETTPKPPPPPPEPEHPALAQEEIASTTLVFGGTARPAPQAPSTTMEFGLKPPTPVAPPLPPSTTMEFGFKPPTPAGPLPPSTTMEFGFKPPTPAGPLPPSTTMEFGVKPPAPAAPPPPSTTLEFGLDGSGPATPPAPAAAGALGFGRPQVPRDPAPQPPPPVAAPFSSSGTMAFGLEKNGAGQLSPALMLERGRMPAAFSEQESPKTSPFGQASLAAAALVGPPKPPRTSPFGDASLARDAVSGASGEEEDSISFDLEPGEPAAEPQPQPPGAAEELEARQASFASSFTPLSMVRPTTEPLRPSGPALTPMALVAPKAPSLTPISLLQPEPTRPPAAPAHAEPPALTPTALIAPLPPQGPRTVTRLSGPPAPSPAGFALTPTALVAPLPAQSSPPVARLSGPVGPAAPGPAIAPEAELDVEVDMDVDAEAEVAPPAAASLPPPPEPEVTDPGSLLVRATDLLDLDDYTGAMAAVAQVLELDPANATALELRERCEATLLAMTESKLGDLTRKPKTRLKPDEIVWLNIDHRAGFLLSLIDGTMSFEDLFSLSSMSRLETARILVQLLQEKAIS